MDWKQYRRIRLVAFAGLLVVIVAVMVGPNSVRTGFVAASALFVVALAVAEFAARRRARRTDHEDGR